MNQTSIIKMRKDFLTFTHAYKLLTTPPMKMMLKILVKAGAPMNLTNNEGQTPFDMAKQQPSGIMANKLAKYKAVCTQDLMETDKNYDRGFKFTKEDPLKDMTFDYKADHKAEIEDKIEKIVEDYQESSEVDHAAKSNIEGTDIEVYIDPVNNKPYDTTLIKTLVKVNIHGHGQYGINSFYKMQVIHHKAKGLYILFNRWGRVGFFEGQHQQTPFHTAEAATSEFKKIFRFKTANEWSRTDMFEKKAGKYNLLAREKNPERMKRFHKQVLKPFLDKSHLKQPNVEDGLVESRLDEHVYRLMKDITNYSELKAIESFFDKDRTPFGLISTESIQKGKEILQKIREENEIQINIFENQKKQDKYEKLTNLTNEFYSIIPFTNFDIENTAIMKSRELNSWEDRLKQISDVSFAFSVLLAAQHRMQEVNPYDYCLGSLDCRIEHMSAESDEAKLISKYIYREGKSCDAKVTGMFRVACQEDTKNYRTDLKNKRLLFHGTKMAHIMSILKNGLQISPKGSIRSGSAYGKGIYFSYDFETSNNYAKGKQNKYMFLCEVSLGKSYDKGRNHRGGSYPMKTTQSTWVQTQEIPNPDKHVTMSYGASLLLGENIQNPDLINRYHYSHNQPEIIVYDAKQVKIRYIIQYK